MSEQDVQAGLSGKPFQQGMSLEDYERGVAMRLGPKVEVPGVAYTLILVSPFLPMVYPVLGLTLYAAVAGVLALGFALPTPKEAEIFVALGPVLSPHSSRGMSWSARLRSWESTASCAAPGGSPA